MVSAQSSKCDEDFEERDTAPNTQIFQKLFCPDLTVETAIIKRVDSPLWWGTNDKPEITHHVLFIPIYIHKFNVPILILT